MSDNNIYSIFFKWLNDNGAIYPKLYLKHHTEEYRCIHAKEEISSSDELLIVPEKLIITHEKALTAEFNKKFSQNIDCEHTHFAVYLLEEKEKGDKSFWAPYINTLPKTYKDMAIFFGEEKLSLLTGTLALKKIEMRKKQLEEDYKNLCSLDKTFSRFSLNEFIWGRLVTITRIFGFDIGTNKTSGLVPLADMLNHKKPDEKTNKTDTHWDFNNKKNSFVITARKSIKKDREIFDSYGFKCNTRFFVNYGFILENDNESDNESYITYKGVDFNVPGFYKKTREGEEKTRTFFNFLRDNIFKNKKNSLENQLELLNTLKNLVDTRISEFKFSLEQLPKLIEDEKDFSLRNTYIMCLSELKVLNNYKKLCNLLIPAIQSKNYRSFMDKKGKKFISGKIDLINDYIKEWILPLIIVK